MLESLKPLQLKSRLLVDVPSGAGAAGAVRIQANPNRHSLWISSNSSIAGIADSNGRRLDGVVTLPSIAPFLNYDNLGDKIREQMTITPGGGATYLFVWETYYTDGDLNT